MREVEPWKTMSDVIQNARAQLVATPTLTSAFRILWVVALHSDGNLVIACIKKQLLGVRQLFVYRIEIFFEALQGLASATTMLLLRG